MNATWGNKSKDEGYFAQVSSLDAGLGQKEQAIREARYAVDLMPIAKDSAIGPQIVTNLAFVYAWTGERDKAIQQLEIVAKIPAGPSYGDLRFPRSGILCKVISALIRYLLKHRNQSCLK